MGWYKLLVILAAFLCLISALQFYQLRKEFKKFEIGDDISKEFSDKSQKKIEIAIYIYIMGIFIGGDLVKYNRVAIIFLLIILLLIACSPYPSLGIDSEIDEVKVSSFKNFGSINDDYHLFFEKEENIKTFIDAINTSRPISGDVDMPEGDYDFLLNFNGGTLEGFHLWISEEYSTGTITKIEDTATAYELTKNSTNKLRKILFH